jgi:hypothetical protein
VVDLASAMCALQKSDYVQKGNLMREFLLLSRELDSMPEGLMRRMFPTDRSPVRLPKDEEGNLLVNEADRNIFGVARPGD